jgi:hypothetical protein
MTAGAATSAVFIIFMINHAVYTCKVIVASLLLIVFLKIPNIPVLIATLAIRHGTFR